VLRIILEGGSIGECVRVVGVLVERLEVIEGGLKKKKK
jgi:hypothetical protein